MKEPKWVMLSAMSLCPHGLSNPGKAEWMADYFLKNYKAVPTPVAAPQCWVCSDSKVEFSDTNIETPCPACVIKEE